MSPPFPIKTEIGSWNVQAFNFNCWKLKFGLLLPRKSLSCTTVLKYSHAQAFLITRSNIRLSLNFETILSVTSKFNSSKLINLNEDKKIFKLTVFFRSFSMRTIIPKKVVEMLLQIRTIWKQFQVLDITVSTWVSEIKTQMWLLQLQPL